MKRNNTVIIFVLGLAIGVLACNIIALTNTPPLYAGTTGKAGSILAVTGAYTQGREGLWVIQTADSDTSPSLCFYVADNGGRAIKLAAARRIKWDLQLVTFKDATRNRRKGDMAPGFLKRKIKEMNEKKDKEAKNKARKR